MDRKEIYTKMIRLRNQARDLSTNPGFRREQQLHFHLFAEELDEVGNKVMNGLEIDDPDDFIGRLDEISEEFRGWRAIGAN